MLGLVQGVSYKAKGGARISVIDASGTKHSVAEKAIHINLGVYLGKLVEPSAILADYMAIMETEASQLGVEPEMLEIAWELAAESEATEYSPRFLMKLIDDQWSASPTETYKAFRLLTSDIGRIFFKAVGNTNKFKVKAGKAVQASKENFCRAIEEAAKDNVGSDEFCFV